MKLSPLQEAIKEKDYLAILIIFLGILTTILVLTLFIYGIISDIFF